MTYVFKPFFEGNPIIGSDFLIRFNVLAYRTGIKLKDILENDHKQKCLEDFLQKEEDIKMDKLEIAKKIIKENYIFAQCGIYNTRSMVPDPMSTLYNENGLRIDICYNYSYFEVFGLDIKEFIELEKFYKSLGKAK